MNLSNAPHDAVVGLPTDFDGAEWWHPPWVSGGVLDRLRSVEQWPEALGGVAEVIGELLGAVNWDAGLPNGDDRWLEHIRPRLSDAGVLFDDRPRRVPLNGSTRRHLETPGIRIIPSIQMRPRDELLVAAASDQLDAAIVMSLGVDHHRLGCLVWFFASRDRVPRWAGRVLAELPTWISTSWSLASRLRRTVGERRTLLEAVRAAAAARGAAHDLDNLLFSLRCRIETLAAMRLEPKVREHVAAVSSGVERLRELAKAMRRRLDREEGAPSSEASTSLGEWWSRREATFRALLPPGASIAMLLAPGTPAVAVAEEDLTQIVSNLVSNSARAIDPEGTVVVSASEVEGAMQVRLTVADDGKGIDAATLAASRDEESRRDAVTDEPAKEAIELVGDVAILPLEESTSRRGMGLVIVRRLLARVGGELRIESALGQGTRTIMQVPTAPPEVDGLAAAVSVVDRGRRLLLGELLHEVGFDLLTFVDSAASLAPTIDLLLVEPTSPLAADLPTILEDRRNAIALLMGGVGDAPHSRIRVLGASTSTDELREVLLAIRRELLPRSRSSRAIRER